MSHFSGLVVLSNLISHNVIISLLSGEFCSSWIMSNRKCCSFNSHNDAPQVAQRNVSIVAPGTEVSRIEIFE